MYTPRSLFRLESRDTDGVLAPLLCAHSAVALMASLGAMRLYTPASWRQESGQREEAQCDCANMETCIYSRGRAPGLVQARGESSSSSSRGRFVLYRVQRRSIEAL
jgi:hypothetical protein